MAAFKAAIDRMYYFPLHIWKKYSHMNTIIKPSWTFEGDLERRLYKEFLFHDYRFISQYIRMGHCLILARVTHTFVTFKASGESTLKVEQSCGLFYQTKLTLAHGTWYLERSSGGYCILPEYRAGRRFPTRLDAMWRRT